MQFNIIKNQIVLWAKQSSTTELTLLPREKAQSSLSISIIKPQFSSEEEKIEEKK